MYFVSDFNRIKLKKKLAHLAAFFVFFLSFQALAAFGPCRLLLTPDGELSSSLPLTTVNGVLDEMDGGSAPPATHWPSTADLKPDQHVIHETEGEIVVISNELGRLVYYRTDNSRKNPVTLTGASPVRYAIVGTPEARRLSRERAELRHEGNLGLMMAYELLVSRVKVRSVLKGQDKIISDGHAEMLENYSLILRKHHLLRSDQSLNQLVKEIDEEINTRDPLVIKRVQDIVLILSKETGEDMVRSGLMRVMDAKNIYARSSVKQVMQGKGDGERHQLTWSDRQEARILIGGNLMLPPRDIRDAYLLILWRSGIESVRHLNLDISTSSESYPKDFFVSTYRTVDTNTLGTFSHMIVQFKDHPSLKVARGITEIVSDAVGDFVTKVASEMPDIEVTVFAVPSTTREGASEFLAQAFSEKSGYDLKEEGLRKAEEASGQMERDLKSRIWAAREAYSVTDSAAAKVKGKVVVLVDDVITSGATIQAAREALIKVGAKAVYVFIYGKTEFQGEGGRYEFKFPSENELAKIATEPRYAVPELKDLTRDPNADEIKTAEEWAAHHRREGQQNAVLKRLMEAQDQVDHQMDSASVQMIQAKRVVNYYRRIYQIQINSARDPVIDRDPLIPNQEVSLDPSIQTYSAMLDHYLNPFLKLKSRMEGRWDRSRSALEAKTREIKTEYANDPQLPTRLLWVRQEIAAREIEKFEEAGRVYDQLAQVLRHFAHRVLNTDSDTLKRVWVEYIKARQNQFEYVEKAIRRRQEIDLDTIRIDGMRMKAKGIQKEAELEMRRAAADRRLQEETLGMAMQKIEVYKMAAEELPEGKEKNKAADWVTKTIEQVELLKGKLSH